MCFNITASFCFIKNNIYLFKPNYFQRHLFYYIGNVSKFYSLFILAEKHVLMLTRSLNFVAQQQQLSLTVSIYRFVYGMNECLYCIRSTFYYDIILYTRNRIRNFRFVVLNKKTPTPASFFPYKYNLFSVTISILFYLQNNNNNFFNMADTIIISCYCFVKITFNIVRYIHEIEASM